MNHTNRTYQEKLEKKVASLIKESVVFIGVVAELKTTLDTFKSGNQNIRTLKWRVMFTNIALLCQSILVVLWNLMSLCIIRTVSKTITD